jgi:hypothetical protein
MRIWSLHPKYLDSKGLVALWRETLLAKHVLEGKTKGYTNHPQLNRFKNSKKPLDHINHYLAIVHEEATNRQYVFDKEKINWKFNRSVLTVTEGQLNYELTHLLRKLKLRDPKKYKELKKIINVETHPLFKVVQGGIEDWEVIL